MSKRMVILGGGESGAGAALLAKKKGYDTFLSDSSSLKDVYRKELADAGVGFEEGGHTESLVLDAGEIVKSPGIPESADIVKKIRAKGIPVISEIELAYRFRNECRTWPPDIPMNVASWPLPEAMERPLPPR